MKVFWPVDERWYHGTVEEYDESKGEHKLRYKDGDTEWVKIGEIAGNGGTTSTRTVEENGKMTQKEETSPPKSASVEPPSAPGPGPKNQGQVPPAPTGQGQGVLSPGQQHQHQQMMFNQGNAHVPGVHPHPQYQPFPHGGYGAPPPGPYQGMPYPPQVGPYPPQQAGPYPPQMQMPPPQQYYPPSMSPHSAVSHSPTNRVSPDKESISRRTSPPKSGSPSKKNPPKTWSKEEDAQLLNLVQRMQIPVKWSYVAQNMDARSGKQCRERYVNHLNPRLKSCDWSPIEDAIIFHLYNTCGSQWAKMSKMIPGRTDNGIKNRFHNLRRQLEREDEQRMRLSKSDDFPEEVRLDRIRTFPEHLRGKADHCWDVFESLGVLAAQSVLGGSLARNASRFGPFRKAADSGEQCARCGLFAPSTHCGTEICTKSKWCIACTRVPPHLCGNVLRECLNLRRIAGEEDKKKNKIDTECMLKTGILAVAMD